MAKINQDAERKVVNPEHHNWVSTDSIKVKLAEAYPRLQFPWLEKEHIHGVNSIVTGACKEHHQVVPMLVGNLWRETTKYGCHECAVEFGGQFDGHEEFNIRRNHPNYKGQSKVEFNLFCALKEVFPDALAHHRMKGRKEIDIWIPSIRAGVEYNGAYYHSDAMGKDKDYHFDKTRSANREGKQIFHIFPEEAESERIIRMMRVLKYGKQSGENEFKVAPKTPLGLAYVRDTEASDFHKHWNFVSVRDSLIHCNIGLFQDNTLIALFGINLTAKSVIKASYAKSFFDIHNLLKWLSGEFGGKFSIIADLRNPVEFGICESGVEAKTLKILSRTAPLHIPLDSNFNLVKIPMYKPADTVGSLACDRMAPTNRTWDCGCVTYGRSRD